MTSAQRARLVVALGVLNLVLASLAFAFGISTPRPNPDIAVVTSAPEPTTSAGTSASPAEPTQPTPSQGEPGGSAGPSATPSTPLLATPSLEATPIPIPLGVLIVGRPPTEPPDVTTPTPQPTPAATPVEPNPTPTAKPPPPKPTPTAKPPPKPTPTPPPQPATHKDVHPPCPGSVDGPPGLNKTTGKDKPCGKGDDKGNGKNGVIIALPLALTAALLSGGSRVAETLRGHGRNRPLRRRRPAR